jgi:tetratricopeptide (TPR) repeat protein
VDLAQSLSEPCWELFFQYWCCEVYIHGLRDLNQGLEKAIQAFILAHKPAYQNCPVLGRVYLILIDAYYIIDAEGYADKIRDMLQYMTENLPLEDDVLLRIQRYRAGLYFTFDEWDDAEREALKFLELSRGIVEREVDAFTLLWNIAIAKKEHERALEYAVQLEIVSKRAGRNISIAFSLLAQALCKQKLNQTDAQVLYQQALAIYEDYKVPHAHGIDFYDAICAYLEGEGNLEAALNLRDQQLAMLVETRNYQFETHCRLQRCRLLGRMGKSVQQELEAAYEAANRLKRPEFYREKLRRVENGNYLED